MSNENRERIDSLGLTEMIDRIIESDVPLHLGKACREILLSIRAATDAVIQRKERKTEVKLQKVTIE